MQTAFICLLDLKGCNIYDSVIELVLAFVELVKALYLNSATVAVAKIINTACCLFSIAYLHKKRTNKLVAGANPSIARSRESVFQYADVLCSIFDPQL